jgi:cobalt/nickel transport system permease protein
LHFHIADQYCDRDSLIHSLDPRVKTLAALFYILAVSLTPEGSWWAFGVFLLLILLASFLSDLGLTYSLRRSYIALPFALAALAVPFTMPGSTIFEVPLLRWSVSEVGLIRFASILIRSWLAVQGAILLTATTQFHDLLWALGKLRFPRSLVAMIGFMYRYIFLIGDEALRMIRARASRSAQRVGRGKPSIRWQGKVTGMMVGSLFLRSLARSERVYDAMLSRCYDGNPRSFMRFRMRWADWIALVVVGVAIFSPVVISRIG